MLICGKIHDTLNLDMKSKLLTLGNFALSTLRKDGVLLKKSLYGGTNFRVVLAAAILGVPVDFVTAIGPEAAWHQILNTLQANNIKAVQLVPLEDSISFHWYFQGNTLQRLESKNLEKMNTIAQLIDNQPDILDNYSHISIGPLGFESEKTIVNLVDPDKHVVFYIFHSSNLDNASLENYFELFKNIDYLFLNHHEAQILTGQNDIMKAGLILSKLAETCFITAEEKGLKVFQQGKFIFHLPALKVDVVNAGGAGDILAGTIISALVKGEDLQTACRLGVLLASISTTDFLTNNLINLI